MCTVNVNPEAEHAVAELLADLATALAEQCGADPSLVRIGPVDLGGIA